MFRAQIHVMQRLKPRVSVFPRKSSTSSDSPNGKDHMAYVAVGFASGALGSLVGMGGAFVALPALTGYFLLSQNVAHGTSMAVVFATSLGACYSYAMRGDSFNALEPNMIDNKKWFGNIPEVVGDINVMNAVCIATTSSIMVVFGAMISKRMPAKYLKLAHGCLMLAVAPMIPLQKYFQSPELLTFKSTIHQSQAQNANATSGQLVDNVYQKLVPPLCIGTFSGTLAGIFGVGGGAVIVPALCLFTDLDYRVALGTSLACKKG